MRGYLPNTNRHSGVRALRTPAFYFAKKLRLAPQFFCSQITNRIERNGQVMREAILAVSSRKYPALRRISGPNLERTAATSPPLNDWSSRLLRWTQACAECLQGSSVILRQECLLSQSVCSAFPTTSDRVGRLEVPRLGRGRDSSAGIAPNKSKTICHAPRFPSRPATLADFVACLCRPVWFCSRFATR